MFTFKKCEGELKFVVAPRHWVIYILGNETTLRVGVNHIYVLLL